MIVGVIFALLGILLAICGVFLAYALRASFESQLSSEASHEDRKHSDDESNEPVESPISIEAYRLRVAKKLRTTEEGNESATASGHMPDKNDSALLASSHREENRDSQTTVVREARRASFRYERHHG